jgi:hypothetical protein
VSIGANGRTLSAATRQLLLQWEQAKGSWHDAKSGEFERKYLAELVAGVDRTAAVFDELDKLVNKVRDDCE